MQWRLQKVKFLPLFLSLSLSLPWRCDPSRVMASSFLRFLDHRQRRTTVGRTLLDEWSARPRDLYLTTHNIHNRQTSMPQVGFEPTISAGERPQTYPVDHAATGNGMHIYIYIHARAHARTRYFVHCSYFILSVESRGIKTPYLSCCRFAVHVCGGSDAVPITYILQTLTAS